MNNVRKFLTEMGGNFTFVGSQYRLEVDGDEYFIDLPGVLAKLCQSDPLIL